MNPLFENSLTGVIKILSIIVGTVLLPLAALIVYFLKRGPEQKLHELEVAMNGLGERLNTEKDDRTAADHDEKTEREKLETRVDGIADSIVGSQRDILEAIHESGKAHLLAVHSVELQVAKLQERNDLGDCLASFAKSIEKLAVAVEHRNGHER